MFLYIVRHAWAGSYGDSMWPDDTLRPLTSQGQKRFRRVAQRLVEAGCHPQLIATSPLLRCRQTAEILASYAPDGPPVVELEALAPGSNLPSLVRWTAEQRLEGVAWVGHAPDVERLTADLIGAGDARIRFAKGSCAAIQFDETLSPGDGTLRWLATAKVLGS